MPNFLFIFLFFISFSCFSQAYEGYTLYSPLQSNTTYLINMNGQVVHQWDCASSPASTAHLLENGSIMRPRRISSPTMTGGAVGGILEIIDWSGNVTWSYIVSDQDYQQHHECIPMKMSNGDYHALIITWNRRSNVEAIQAGRQGINGEMWPTSILEIEPVGANGGNIVWKWEAWDHLCQDVDSLKDNYKNNCDNHPELIDINVGNVQTGGFGGGGGDWIHANGIDWDPIRDQIVFSSHTLDEIFVIDHSTTTLEAASNTGGNSGRGGDILYRWGMPANYGAAGSQELYVVHGANFIDEGSPGAGNLMCFNNGNMPGNSNDNSEVLEIDPPYDGNYNYTLPWNQNAIWTYSDPGNFYSNHLSGAFRLPNGNTLVSEGTSLHIFEVTENGNIVFDYTHPGGGNFAKATRYGHGYSGLVNIYEKYDNTAISVFPNPFRDKTNIIFSQNSHLYSVQVYDYTGKVCFAENDLYGSEFLFKRNSLIPGVYFIQIEYDNKKIVEKLIIY